MITPHIMFFVLLTLMLLLLIPLIGFILYIGRFLLDGNGHPREFRKAMFWVACAKLVFFITEIAVIITAMRTEHEAFWIFLLIPLNVGAVLLTLANWNAFIVTRKIIKDERS